MAKELLFYEKAIPVSRDKHRDWSVKTGKNYDFARETNSVPLTAVEMPLAGQEYAVVFAGTEKAVVPVAILGVQDKQNLYVDENGSWKAHYIPAFVRRYPFVFTSTDEGKTFTLCIDESFSGCNQQGQGERLFDSDGERTQYLSSVLNFHQEYQAHFKRTQTFCQKLKDLSLLEPMQATVNLPSGQKLSLSGFSAVNREKLRELPGDKLSALAKTGELELIYTHLISLRNFSAMLERIVPQPSKGNGQDLSEMSETGREEPAAGGEDESEPKKKK